MTVKEKRKLNVASRNITRDMMEITTTTDDAVKKEEKKIEREKKGSENSRFYVDIKENNFCRIDTEKISKSLFLFCYFN